MSKWLRIVVLQYAMFPPKIWRTSWHIAHVLLPRLRLQTVRQHEGRNNGKILIYDMRQMQTASQYNVYTHECRVSPLARVVELLVYIIVATVEDVARPTDMTDTVDMFVYGDKLCDDS